MIILNQNEKATCPLCTLQNKGFVSVRSYAAGTLAAGACFRRRKST